MTANDCQCISRSSLQNAHNIHSPKAIQPKMKAYQTMPNSLPLAIGETQCPLT